MERRAGGKGPGFKRRVFSRIRSKRRQKEKQVEKLSMDPTVRGSQLWSRIQRFVFGCNISTRIDDVVDDLPGFRDLGNVNLRCYPLF